MLTLPRVFLITAPESVPNEGPLINKLLIRSKCVLHMRKPEAPIELFSSLLDSIDRQHHHRIMIHSHHSLAKDYGVMGLHTPAWMRQDASASCTKHETAQLFDSPNLCSSTSLHSLDEINSNGWFRQDYVFLSPIFDSLSKKGYKSAGFDEGALSSAIYRARPLRVVALGGVTGDRIEKVARMGFHGVAVIGAVWESRMGPEAAMDQLEQEVRDVWGTNEQS